VDFPVAIFFIWWDYSNCGIAFLLLMSRKQKTILKTENTGIRMKPYALITGASKGFGKALAIEVSKRNFNTILVSLPNEGLESVCNELMETYGTDSKRFETDLSIPQNVIELAGKVNASYDVFMLFNNAGIGGSKRFTDAGLDYVNSIIQLNVTATTLLTHQLMPNLLKQPRSYILNVSSIAAYQPTGYKTVYPASKSFIRSFSLGLFQEFKGTNVHVSVVCPGAMKTNEEITKRIEQQGFFSKLILTDTEKTARVCIRKLLTGYPIIKLNPGIRFFSKLLPFRLKLSIITKTVKREIELF
jgi:uncharacterized protein